MQHKKSLAVKLVLFTAVTVFLVVGTTMVFFITSFSSMRRETARLTNAYFTHINGRIMSSLADSNELVEIFAFNNDVQSYLSSDDADERYRYYEGINDLYTTVMGVKPGFKDLIVIDHNMQGISIGGNLYDFNKVRDYYAAVQHLNEGIIDVCDFSAVYSATRENNIVSAYPVYTGMGNVRKNVGALLFVMDLQPVIDIMETVKFTQSSQTLLFSESGNLLCGTTDCEILQQEWQNRADFPKDGEEITLGGIPYLCFESRHDKAEFFLLSIVPKREIYVYSKTYTGNAIILIIINTIVIVVMALYINHSFRKPVQSLLGSMEAVQKGDLSIRTHIQEESEIGLLANSFDNMMNRIQSMTKTIVESQARMYEMELTGRQMELKALQSQINPHFLYNTLACIQSIAICNEESEILEITKALADMYKYILRFPDIVTLKQEIDNIQNYLIIQKMRLGDRLFVEFEIDPTALDQKILKLLLQPIVENAIEHGICEKVSGGKISLRIKRNAIQNKLNIVVQDDGAGMSQEKLREMSEWCKLHFSASQAHVGMQSVLLRLNIAYQDKYTFQCNSEIGRGTTFEISIPCQNSAFLFDESSATKEKITDEEIVKGIDCR